MNRALQVGITGKFGSGKSTLSRLLRDQGFILFESDAVAKEIMTKDAEVRFALIDLLGDEAYTANGLNRSFIASRIFSNPELRAEVEAIVHPRVTSAMRLAFESAPTTSILAVESALILQTDLWMEFDYIVLVEVKDEVAVERLGRSDKFSQEDIRARLDEQNRTPLDREEVDFTIDNNGTLEDFKRRTNTIASILKALSARDLPYLPLHQLELEYEDA